MIDTIYFLSRYIMPNGFNPSNPDIVRFYAFAQNLQDTLSNQNRDYYKLYWPGKSNYRQAMAPIIEYIGQIPDKGHGTVRPKGDYITWDYILTEEDANEFIGNSFSPIVWIPDGGIKIPPGYTISILVEYIPGDTNYNLGDTIVSYWYNDDFPIDDDRHFVGSNTYMNHFSISRWEYRGDTEDNFYPNFKDAHGYNTFLSEDMNVRYAIDTQNFGSGTFYRPDLEVWCEFYYLVKG